MLIGIYNYHAINNQNKIFEEVNNKIDDFFDPLKMAVSYIMKNGYKIEVYDVKNVDSYDLIIFIEYPTFLNFKKPKILKEAIKHKKRLFLVLMECEIIKKSNYYYKNHKYFEKVFTWKDNLVDNKKYFRYFWPQIIDKSNIDKNITPFEQKKLCIMISGYKLINHKLELYNERINTIKFFQEKHPNDFDLYGNGRNSFTSSNKYLNFVINKFSLVKKVVNYLFKPYFPLYKGKIDKKVEILKKYKFSICYENARINSYVTEKIFDCFFAGCVPIYLGGENISDIIPKETFIDKRDFDSLDSLYNYIKNMDENKYNIYINAIRNFLNSNDIEKFSYVHFASCIMKEI